MMNKLKSLFNLQSAEPECNPDYRKACTLSDYCAIGKETYYYNDCGDSYTVCGCR